MNIYKKVPVRCSKSHKVADERKMAQKFQAISVESLFLEPYCAALFV
jgi:hypothetical protein